MVRFPRAISNYGTNPTVFFCRVCCIPQKEYLISGSFPEEVRLVRAGDNNVVEGRPIPTPRPFKKAGFKVSSRALNMDNDWVSNLFNLVKFNNLIFLNDIHSRHRLIGSLWARIV